MSKPKLTVVTEAPAEQVELAPLFVDALHDFLKNSEYLSHVQTENIQEFTLVFKDDEGVKILGDTNTPEVLKSRLSMSVWAMNFQEQFGNQFYEDDDE